MINFNKDSNDQNLFLDILTLKINYFKNIDKYIENSNRRFLNEIEQKNTEYFNLIEKKASKILVVYKYIFKEMNIKNLICNMIYYNLFLEKSKDFFKVQYSKYILINMNEIILENLKYNNIQSIRKIGVLLSGDNWKRVALQDDHE